MRAQSDPPCAPAVSVVLPVWNADPAFLRQAVRSILDQTLADFELLVIEDPSPRMCGDLLESFGDRRIRYSAHPARTSLPDQLNRGLASARAGLIARMDADDVAEPERLERQHRFLLAHPECDVVGGQIELIDPRDRPLGERRYPTDPAQIVRALRRHNALAHPSVMFRRECVERAGGYRAYPHVEDYELWCRLARSGVGFANLPEVVLRYRVHPLSSKSQATRRTLRNSVAVKQLHWKGQLDWGDRLRIALERLLLLLPPRLIHRLFLLSAVRHAPAQRSGAARVRQYV
jgi:glycosyltransferase involved in cell wall biosynthesis